MTPLRVLLADDSPLFPRWVETELTSSGALTIVGVAPDGKRACELNESLRPDLVLMDVHMPVMNGLDAIARIMASRPTPIVVTTGDPGGREGALAFEALRRGAVDVLAKPERWHLDEPERQRWRTRLIGLARARARREETRPYVRPASTLTVPQRAPFARAIGIGASTGGPAALAAILAQLPDTLNVPLFVVQHLAPGFVGSLAEWLGRVTRLCVRVARDGDTYGPSDLILAPDGSHMTLMRDRVRLVPDAGPGHVPSISILFGSLCREFGSASMGILLTGMGTDGVDGLCGLHAAGAWTMAQDESSSVVWGMPGAAVARGAARYTGSPAEIARAIGEASGSRCAG